MKHLAIIVLVSLLASIGFGQSKPGERQILKALRDYDNAWNKKNADGVSRMLADDYVYFSSVGGLTDRRSTLTFLVAPDYVLTFVERSDIKIVSYTGNVAVVSSRWKGKGTYGKEAIDDDQRCGLVFVKQANTWKLLSEHCTQIVSKT